MTEEEMNKEYAELQAESEVFLALCMEKEPKEKVETSPSS